jgi:hypothetical protein
MVLDMVVVLVIFAIPQVIVPETLGARVELASLLAAAMPLDAIITMDTSAVMTTYSNDQHYNTPSYSSYSYVPTLIDLR